MQEANAPSRGSKAGRIALWILGALPALGVGVSGAAKFFPATHWQDYFVGWGYPSWFALVTGTLEVAGAILTFVPRFARYGASLLATIMAGAAVTLQLHRTTPPGWTPIGPLVYAVIFATVAVLWWRQQKR